MGDIVLEITENLQFLPRSCMGTQSQTHYPDPWVGSGTWFWTTFVDCQASPFSVPPGAPTFTRKPQILQKTAEGGEPAIVFDIGFQADFPPTVTWLNPKGKKMKESSRIKFILNNEGAPNAYVAQLELKVSSIRNLSIQHSTFAARSCLLKLLRNIVLEG